MKSKLKDTKLLTDKKMLQRAELPRQGEKKKEKTRAIIEDLRNTPLIVTVEEFELRKHTLFSLSLPLSLKEAELRVLIKRQVQLRNKVYLQSVVLNQSENGKMKPLERLCQGLASIIKNNPVKVQAHLEKSHQELYVIFDKPSFLVGCRVKHRFEVGAELVWFDGEIVSYRKQEFSLLYPKTTETCLFFRDELKEDFYSGDLWFL